MKLFVKPLRIVWIGCLGASLFVLGLLRGSTELILSGALFFVSFMLLSAQLSMYGWDDKA